MACVDCKDNIINKTPSLIGEPKCGGDCPPETTCDGGYIASTCVYYSGNNLACTGINYGLDLTEAIKKLNDKLCEIKCEKLTWVNIELNAPYYLCEFPPPTQFQNPQYAVDPCNGKIWLRGTICIPEENSTDLVFTIPNYPPLYIRQYYTVIYEDGLPKQKRLIVTSNGTDAEFYINNAVENGYIGQILLDGLSYEIN